MDGAARLAGSLLGMGYHGTGLDVVAPNRPEALPRELSRPNFYYLLKVVEQEGMVWRASATGAGRNS